MQSIISRMIKRLTHEIKLTLYTCVSISLFIYIHLLPISVLPLSSLFSVSSSHSLLISILIFFSNSSTLISPNPFLLYPHLASSLSDFLILDFSHLTSSLSNFLSLFFDLSLFLFLLFLFFFLSPFLLFTGFFLLFSVYLFFSFLRLLSSLFSLYLAFSFANIIPIS